MSAYTATRDLPLEHIQPGDEILIGIHERAWHPVIEVVDCDGRCIITDCAGRIRYATFTVHYPRSGRLAVRIPCEPGPVDESAAVADLRAEVDRLHTLLAERNAAPAGPADADPVWVSVPRAGIPMHRVADPTAARTTCDRATRAGRVTTAANARQRWDSVPCPRCWPGAAS